ncbi:hypothetical protein O181_112100 [Austropuccinia psidii MF-1]|uniref:Uncharacterized protein n=1 Tax=Austropuccinia psidii MF-1 TaxID=1389203 RepID=A0A9Q3JZS8_9BASI|nr:hypothetical protein [Austropuccinia psidii MF-1]
MEEMIQSKQMDLEMEEERPGPNLEGIPQERHIWRIPEFSLIPQGEDHRTLRRMKSFVLQRKGQKDEELIEEKKYFIHILEERVGNDPSFGERMTTSVNKIQTSSRIAQRTSGETERSQEQSRQGKRKGKSAQTLPTRVKDSKFGTFSHG